MEDHMEIHIQKKISPGRWRHSLGVAATARKLASFWGADPDKAWLTGILHDYAREVPGEQLVQIAVRRGYVILAEEKVNPVVLHAPVGAWLVGRDFGIKDPEVLSAITKHTVGGEQMSLLDKIIFLSDMIEPGRKWPGVEELRALAYKDINQTMLLTLDSTIQYLKEKKQVIHPLTLLARENIVREIQGAV